jgi:hypothetical protein
MAFKDIRSAVILGNNVIKIMQMNAVIIGNKIIKIIEMTYYHFNNQFNCNFNNKNDYQNFQIVIWILKF